MDTSEKGSLDTIVMTQIGVLVAPCRTDYEPRTNTPLSFDMDSRGSA